MRSLLFVSALLLGLLLGLWAGYSHRHALTRAAAVGAEAVAWNVRSILPAGGIELTECERALGLDENAPSSQMYAGIERVAVYFDYITDQMNDIMNCVDPDSLACEEKWRLAGQPEVFQSKKRIYEKIPESIRPRALFKDISVAVAPLLDSCGGKKKPITLHYYPTDEVFQQAGTFAVYVLAEHDFKTKAYYLKVYKYRPDRNKFSVLRGGVHDYRGETQGRMLEEISAEMQENFKDALLP